MLIASDGRRSHRFVLDACTVVAMILDGEQPLPSGDATELLAPSVMPYEVANVVRRQARRRRLDRHRQDEAFGLLSRIPVTTWPWDAVASRVWELRDNLTSYDASYVAVAEMADATLLTRDKRMAAAPGIRCRIEVVPKPS